MSSTQSIALLLLTAGRADFLLECINSVRKQSRRPSRVVLINDGPSLSETTRGALLKEYPEAEIHSTAQPRSGQWAAFRLGLKKLGSTQPFAIVHDDDRLKTDYVETLAEFASRQEGPWICSHNLEVFYEITQDRHLILPKENRPFRLKGKLEICLRYSHNFIPFPGTCFGLPASEVAARIHEEYREMADVVLLCECAQLADVFYEPRPIYEYRRHGSQVSDRMDDGMEDKLQAYLLQSTGETGIGKAVSRNLEKRRAERYFTWAWKSGTFRGYPFRTDFSWQYVFRAVRNQKLKALKILLRATLQK